MRKGDLSQGAVGLALFVRDVCGGDVVAWLDSRLAGVAASRDPQERAAQLRAAVLDPLTNIHGMSAKVASMALANLLLGAHPGRRNWKESGAAMVVVDTLIHAFLHRTGILRRAGAEHASVRGGRWWPPSSGR